mmetsp:Transcript_21626/g.62049  ORF Transcript_21626/g.62049 Transcript_21626/m.62049 type:complete len:214 (-) Transcript_21626:86-727(-)
MLHVVHLALVVIQIHAQMFCLLERSRDFRHHNLLPFGRIFHHKFQISLRVHLVPGSQNVVHGCIGHCGFVTSICCRCRRRRAAARWSTGININGALCRNITDCLGDLCPCFVHPNHGLVVIRQCGHEIGQLTLENRKSRLQCLEIWTGIIGVGGANRLLQASCDPRFVGHCEFGDVVSRLSCYAAVCINFGRCHVRGSLLIKNLLSFCVHCVQ